eukprot:evm.model.scf_447EXC.2 EVM.evm.TU.scf_447EXC.2   scf_447EXC:14068-17358(-)
MRGYALRQCLREAREKETDVEGSNDEDVRGEYLKLRQYEQPGELVTLPSGVQYREFLEGTGRSATAGSVCDITYIVYRLSSGAYFKYSSGGTPVLLFATGYGTEGKDDVGSTYRFRLAERNSLPAAATPAVVGMKEGGRRRILIPPEYGWVNDSVGPIPDTFGGRRRLAAHKDEPLLLEVELTKVYPSGDLDAQGSENAGSGSGEPFKLPAPPSPFESLLG